MNIFSSLQRYAGKWSVSDSRSFNAEEKADIIGTEVVDSEFGKSVCFFMASGGKTFIPLSNQSTLEVGDSIDMEKAKLLTLSRQGSADINRVEA